MKKETKNAKAKVKKESFVASVRKELSNVTWPTKGNVFKYTVATVVFILFVTGFFLLLNLGLSVIKGWFV